MAKENNFVILDKYFLKVNINMVRDGMEFSFMKMKNMNWKKEKDMLKKIIIIL